MPYNLRKRKAPEPEPEPVPADKKPAAKKPAATRKLAAKKVVEEELTAKKTKKAETTVNDTAAKKLAVKKEAIAAVVKRTTVKKQKVEKKVVEPEESGDESAREEAEAPKEEEKKEEIEEKVKVEKSKKKKPAINETVVIEPAEKKSKVETTNGGKLFMFGEDTCGEFGLAKIGFTKKKPTEVPIAENIVQVACGPMHTLSLTESGLVYSHGCNDEGALGRVTDGDETLDATPTVVKLKNKVIKISTGDSHGVALTDKNEVFVWGNFRDERGHVGLTPEMEGKHSFEPIQMMVKTQVTDIASGSNHVLLVDNKGKVYSFGVGEQGQLGRLSPEEIEEAIQAHTQISEARAELDQTHEDNAEAETAIAEAKAKLKKAQAVMVEKRRLFLTPQIVDLKNVDPQRPFVCDAVFAGTYCSFATNTDKKKNRTAGWGLNNYYQLGYKGQKGQLVQHYPRRSTFTCSTSMISVAPGTHHTLFLTKTGRVYAAGRNEYGMLGVGSSENGKKEVCPAAKIDHKTDDPITIICAGGNNNSFSVDSAGKLYTWGMAGPSQGTDRDAGDKDYMVPTQKTSLADKEVLSVSSKGEFAAVIVK